MLQNARQIYNIAKETANEIVLNRDSDSEGDKSEPAQKTMSDMWSDITKNSSQISNAVMLQDLTKVDILELRLRVLMLIQPSSWNMGTEWWATLQVSMTFGGFT